VTPAATAKVDDADGDGIADLVDECPFVAGKAEFFGCPDSDNDKIGDSRDKCPFEAGTLEASGCPGTSKVITMEAEDADADGIADADDLCPDEAGPAANNGCPSTDVATKVDDVAIKAAADAAKASADAAKALEVAKATATKAVTKTTTKATEIAKTTKATTAAVTKSTKTLSPPPAATKAKVIEKYVAPVETANQKLVGSYTIYMNNGTIAPGQIETLQAVSALLKSNPNYIVRLNGYVNNTKRADPDMDKSMAFAQKVSSALSMKGVEMKRTKLVGYGGDRTKFFGKETGKNNRVELEVYSFE
jgi:outer membrane protein OmpA-like peptidoglycan-associated protein